MGDEDTRTDNRSSKKIWIDLDNSPHVPFFLPIMEELRNRGYLVILSARNSYQVCELLKLYNLPCAVIGKHWGKNRLLKIIETCLRTIQVLPFLLKNKPALALSHGSRAQILAGIITKTPTILMYDYEFSQGLSFLSSPWQFMPQYVPDPVDSKAKAHTMKYPGLKEDVYVPRFRPDPTLRTKLGLASTDLVITVRPPAIEAHYHNKESDKLFDAAMTWFMECPEVRVILLPRNERQASSLRDAWGKWIAERKIVIPDQVVDGLNLIWFSDLVVSGGGTMNREAAALGVPVYSIFRGRIGAVDKYLAENSRLVLLESVHDVREKINLVRRNPQAQAPVNSENGALSTIVEGIVSILERNELPG
jgi:predicted glycosyltransferase